MAITDEHTLANCMEYIRERDKLRNIVKILDNRTSYPHLKIVDKSTSKTPDLIDLDRTMRASISTILKQTMQNYQSAIDEYLKIPEPPNKRNEDIDF